MRELGIWIEREFKLRVKTKGYWIFTIIGMVILVAFTFLPTLMNWINQSTTSRVVIADPQKIAAAMLKKTVQAKPDAYNFKLVSTQASGIGQYNTDQMKQFMKQEHAKIVVLVKGDNAANASFVIEENGTINPAKIQNLQTLLQQTVTQARIAQLPKTSQAQLAAPVAIATKQWQSNSKSMKEVVQSEIVVYFLLILLFATIITYGNWVTQGVVEEKSNRIIEMLLITSRPWQILFGKVVGIALVGLLQYAIWMVAIGCIRFIPHHLAGLSVHNVPISVLAWFPVFFIIGFFLWSIVYGIAGSLVTRSEEQQMAVMPVMFAVIISFYLALFAVLPNPDSLFAKIISFIPMLSPLTMSTRLALSDVPAWQIAVAIALDIVWGILLVRWGAGVYRKFALRTSGKASWRILWKKEHASES